MMATCGKCGYDGPFNHGCGPSPASVSLVPRVQELEAENARLQERVEEARTMHDERVDELMACEALAERRKDALPDPDKLRLLADWFDMDDVAKGRRGSTLATLGGQSSDEVQQELRGWARDIDAAIEEEA